MNAIVIDYDPFCAESRMNIYKNGKQEHISVHSDVTALANAIIKLAYENDIYEVKSHAPWAFTSEIARQVHACEQDQYTAQKIQVEGI